MTDLVTALDDGAGSLVVRDGVAPRLELPCVGAVIPAHGIRSSDRLFLDVQSLAPSFKRDCITSDRIVLLPLRKRKMGLRAGEWSA